MVMPFYHEVGSPPWKATPRWVEEEEREWAAEEEEMMRMCPWKRRRARGRIRYESTEGEEEGKPRASASIAPDTSTEVGGLPGVRCLQTVFSQRLWFISL